MGVHDRTSPFFSSWILFVFVLPVPSLSGRVKSVLEQGSAWRKWRPGSGAIGRCHGLTVGPSQVSSRFPNPANSQPHTSHLHPPGSKFQPRFKSISGRNPAFPIITNWPCRCMRKACDSARSIYPTLNPSLRNQFVSPRTTAFLRSSTSCSTRFPDTRHDHGVRNAYATGRRRRSQLGCFPQGSLPCIVSSSGLLAPVSH